jgi:peptidoglycan/LPS O-acetylase OafA/YrhL
MNQQFDSPVSYREFKYIPTLDGWRAISVLGVIFFHSLHNGLQPGSFLFRLAVHGYLGVDMFFAISGFLICGKLLNELAQTNTISLKRFYIRRFFRIVPPLALYLAVLAILTLSGWILVKSWEFESSVFFLRNYFPTFHDVVIGQYTAHFWSLAVEEHFYLLVPMVILCMGRKPRRLAWTVLTAALCVFIWRSFGEAHQLLIPYGVDVTEKTDTRIDALLWGCLAAVVYPKAVQWLRSLGWQNLSVVIAAALVTAICLHAPGLTLLEAMLFPALLISTAVFPDSLLGRALEWPVMKWIGRLSYSLYIWQQLAIFPTLVPDSPMAVLQQVPLNLVVMLALASASYYFVEKPAIRMGRRLEMPSHRDRSFRPVPMAAKS